MTETETTRPTREGQVLRVRFDGGRALHIADLRDRLEELESLLFVAAVAQEVDQWKGSMAGWWREDGGSALARDQVAGARVHALGLARLRRVSYASPLEIVLYASAITGAATSALGVAYSAVRLFERVQMAKVTKARADAQTLAYHVLADDLRLRVGPEHRDHYTLAALGDLDKRHRQDVDRAIGALTSLQAADVVDETEV